MKISLTIKKMNQCYICNDQAQLRCNVCNSVICFNHKRLHGNNCKVGRQEKLSRTDFQI